MWPFNKKKDKYCGYCGTQLEQRIVPNPHNPTTDLEFKVCPKYLLPGTEFVDHYRVYVRELKRIDKYDTETGEELWP